MNWESECQERERDYETPTRQRGLVLLVVLFLFLPFLGWLVVCFNTKKGEVFELYSVYSVQSVLFWRVECGFQVRRETEILSGVFLFSLVGLRG